jgi:hypothetical protein
MFANANPVTTAPLMLLRMTIFPRDLRPHPYTAPRTTTRSGRAGRTEVDGLRSRFGKCQDAELANGVLLLGADHDDEGLLASHAVRTRLSSVGQALHRLPQ